MSSAKEMDPIRSDLRLAGLVERYHTWPHIHKQSVAEHSWQVARILLTIAPNISRNVLIYVQFHDAGEHHVGDIPYPVKRDCPALKVEMDKLEHAGLEKMLIVWDMSPNMTLTNYDLRLVKIAELIEMMEWGQHEVLLGNRYGEVVRERCRDALWVMLSDTGDDELSSKVSQYILTRDRLTERLNGCK